MRHRYGNLLLLIGDEACFSGVSVVGVALKINIFT